MSEALIREIAQQIVQEQLLLNWEFYAVLLALMIVGSVVSAFVLPYIRKRGETYATKADFEELLNQLRATTETAEKIKTAIAHSDWTAKEWKTLRRVKLEELIETVYALRIWIEDALSVRLFSDKTKLPPSPAWKLELLVLLYFPELRSEIKALTLAQGELNIWTLGVAQKLAAEPTDLEARQVIFDTVRTDMPPLYQKILFATSAIEEKAPSVMKEIVGV